jgi:hypothetical protein
MSSKERFLWLHVSFAIGIVLVAVIFTSSEARVRRTTVTPPSPVEQQKPIKLRYYGGPKYPMYPG